MRNSLFGLIVATVTACIPAILHGEPPTLSLTDEAQLAVAGIPADAPTTIELGGPDVLPITWRRGNATAANLPLVLMPAVADPAVVVLFKQQRSLVIGEAAVPRVRIDPRAYEAVTGWRPTASPEQRRRTLLLAAAFATTLLLAALLRRGRAIAVVGVALLWSVGLHITADSRPTLLSREEADGSRWFLATEAQTLRVSIIAGGTWVPVVASTAQLERLSPRILVNAESAHIELDIPADTKLLLIPSPR